MLYIAEKSLQLNKPVGNGLEVKRGCRVGIVKAVCSKSALVVGLKPVADAVLLARVTS